MSRKNMILLFGFIALVAVVAIVATADTNDERGTRAGETYVGSERCELCHEEYANWEETPHGIDFANDWEYHGTPTNKYTYGDGNDTTGMTGSCASCHVVGYNQTSGFDPALPWNSTDTTNNVGNIKLLRIGCENCHGPASAHVEPGSNKTATINLGPDPYYESCLGTEEAECHSGYRQGGNESIGGWTQSVHGPKDDLANPASESGSLNRYCARCKDPSNYGGPEAERTDTYDIEEFRGITCGDCHDLHPDPADTHEYQLIYDEEEICEVCHEGSHGTMRNSELDDVPTVAREDYPYMDEVSCVECHMWSSPRELRGTEYEHQGHDFEPTIDACLECHTTIFEDIPSSKDTTNWTAWEEDYNEVYEEWDEVVKAQQVRYYELKVETEELLHKVGGVVSHGTVEERGLKQAAEENGTWTTDMENRLENATINVELASESSNGTHNPAYGTALLTDAKEILMELDDELSVGILKGKVTDASEAGIAGVYISVVNGIGTKTGSDGWYELELDSGTYTVSAFKKGTIEKSASNVVVTAPGVTEQNFTLASDFDNDGTGDETDTDDDNDGMPDVWETNNSLDPKDPTDAYDDDDNDGLTNLQEYKDGLDPQIADKAGEEKEEADTTLYLIMIIVLIVIIVLLIVMLVKKGRGAPAPPPEESREEPLPEEEEEEDTLEE